MSTRKNVFTNSSALLLLFLLLKAAKTELKSLASLKGLAIYQSEVVASRRSTNTAKMKITAFAVAVATVRGESNRRCELNIYYF